MQCVLCDESFELLNIIQVVRLQGDKLFSDTVTLHRHFKHEKVSELQFYKFSDFDLGALLTSHVKVPTLEIAPYQLLDVTCSHGCRN